MFNETGHITWFWGHPYVEPDSEAHTVDLLPPIAMADDLQVLLADGPEQPRPRVGFRRDHVEGIAVAPDVKLLRLA